MNDFGACLLGASLGLLCGGLIFCAGASYGARRERRQWRAWTAAEQWRITSERTAGKRITEIYSPERTREAFREVFGAEQKR